MASPTFLQMLASEVKRMRSLHPEREAELTRAHALIRLGAVCPTVDDPETATVLSSDGTTQYRVNGVCSCPAGQHGKGCKHLHAWRLYRHIDRKLAAQAAQEPTDIAVDRKNAPTPLPEAASSANVRVLISDHEVQFTMRGTSDEAVLTRLQALLKRSDVRPLPKPQPRQSQWRKGGPRVMQATVLHTIKTSQGTSDDDPYQQLVTAIITRAVSDALGYVSPSRHVSPATLQEEALAWLEEAQGLTELLELGGFDAEPVVRAIRQCLAEEAEHDSAITA